MGTSPGIAGRGGETLFTRGQMDQKWTRDEYLGGFYYYAPYPLNAVLRRVFGYSREDTTRIGGRLQRIAEAPGTDFAAHLEGQPDKTYTYFWEASQSIIDCSQSCRRRVIPIRQ